MPLRPLLSRDTARGPEAQGGASEQSSLFTLMARGGSGVWGEDGKAARDEEIRNSWELSDFPRGGH